MFAFVTHVFIFQKRNILQNKMHSQLINILAVHDFLLFPQLVPITGRVVFPPAGSLCRSQCCICCSCTWTLGPGLLQNSLQVSNPTKSCRWFCLEPSKNKQARRAFLLNIKRHCSLNERDITKVCSLTEWQHYVIAQGLVLLAACNHSWGAMSWCPCCGGQY